MRLQRYLQFKSSLSKVFIVILVFVFQTLNVSFHVNRGFYFNPRQQLLSSNLQKFVLVK